MMLNKFKFLKTIRRIVVISIPTGGLHASAQNNTTPTAITQQNAISLDGASGFASMYSGVANYSLPIYTVKCGSLSLPISLNYSYNGLRLDETIEWTGLGWSLQAGGEIDRVVQGGIDYTKNSGYNYGQYSIKDSLTAAHANFFNNIYADAHDTSFDSEPDVYSASFNGYSVQFYWYNGKAYMLNYNKEFQISWPGSTGPITITTGDGTAYNFAQTQAAFLYEFKFFRQVNYNAAYYLSSVISADKKDTISLVYTTHTTQSYLSDYDNYYPQGTYPFSPELNTDTVLPTNSFPILQNILCRNSRVSFIPDTALRTDEQTPGPKLREIDVVDSISGTLVKKQLLSYSYVSPQGYPKLYGRLLLKTFSNANPTLLSDSQTYKFYYNQETAFWSPKFTDGIDDWGFYSQNSAALISHSSIRTPNFTYCSYGALDTISLPTGGLRTYLYELNTYDSGGTQHMAPGPGIRVKTISDYLPGTTIPASSKTYTYLADNGTSSSGSVLHFSSTSQSIPIVDSFDFNNYVMTNNNPGSAVKQNIFYYSKVSELSSGGKEKHKSDYYFKSYSNAFDNVVMTKKIDYRYDTTLLVYSPMSSITSTYDSTTDSSFLSIRPYIDSSYVNSGSPNTLLFVYAYTYDYNPTIWLRLTDQTSVQYDNLNDSSTQTMHYNYNAARNMDSVRTTLPDGTAIIKKYKYADDYTSAITSGLVSHHVLDPVIETQEWLQHPGGAPAMISGAIISYDTVIFKPVAMYSLEPASPLTSLNNETLTSGQYNTLLSDNVNYILKNQLYYDGYNHLDHVIPASDITTSMIWDYKHSMPVAEVVNATGYAMAYTSFEADNDGNWSIPDTTRNRTSAMTGNRSYNLVTGKTIAASFPAGTPYVISYWSNSTAATVMTGSTGVAANPGLTKNGWTYYEHITSSTATSVSITSSGMLIDELRLYPTNAQMTTHTYAPSIGKISDCSPNNMISYYDYDGYNRLKDIKDMDRNTVKLFDYQFNQSYSYKNVVTSGGFVKNNCACDYQGSGTVTYTVAANTYTSHASQWDANQLAQNDVNANGQNYANTNGSCVAIPCSGAANKIIYCTTCQTGTKVYTSSVWSPTLHEYVCTYHYLWSDGSISGDYQEDDKTSCTLN